MSWWKPWTAWVALAGGAVLVAVARALVRPGGDDRPGVVVALIVLTLATAGLAILCAAVQHRPTAADFGLVRPPHPGRAALAALAAVAVVFVTSVASATLFGLDEDSVDVTDRLAADRGPLNAVLVLVLVAVITPVGEEVLFRAYAFRALLPWRGAVTAAVLTTGVFTLFHVGWAPGAALAPIAVFGLAMCWLFLRAGSLYPPLAVHALINSTSLAFLFDGAWGVAAVAAAVVLTVGVARVVALALGPPPAMGPGGRQTAIVNRSTIS